MAELSHVGPGYLIMQDSKIRRRERIRAELSRWSFALMCTLLGKGVVMLAMVGFVQFVPGQTWMSLDALKQLAVTSFARWDAGWFIQIAQEGYQTAKSTAFFPC